MKKNASAVAKRKTARKPVCKPWPGDEATERVAKPNRVVEVMTRRVVGPYTIRVWSKVNADVHKIGPDNRVNRALSLLHEFSGTKAIMDAIDRLGPELVAAYEILNHNGNGTVVYPDWN